MAHFDGSKARQGWIASAGIAGLFLLVGCGESNSVPPMSPSPAPAPELRPTPDPTAGYRVTFDATWSAATHPNMAPANPHFSPLIGTTHPVGFRLWSVGEIASNGMESMAERGAITPLDQEIRRAIDNGRAEFLLSGGDIPASPGSVSLDFSVGLDHPAVTLVSMLAPSPDWFVGVDGLSLLENGDWVDEIVVELVPYDAGTDSGTSFNSPDRDTAPREPIAVIDAPPLAAGGSVSPVGTFTFRRQ